MKTDKGDEIGGKAFFANGRYFLHEVLQHLFDIENELQKKGGSPEKAMQEYQNHKQEWEDRAFENENEKNMPGVDIDEY